MRLVDLQRQLPHHGFVGVDVLLVDGADQLLLLLVAEQSVVVPLSCDLAARNRQLRTVVFGQRVLVVAVVSG